MLLLLLPLACQAATTRFPATEDFDNSLTTPPPPSSLPCPPPRSCRPKAVCAGQFRNLAEAAATSCPREGGGTGFCCRDVRSSPNDILGVRSARPGPRPLPRLPATQEQEVAVRTSFNRQRPELQLRVSEVDQETSGHALFGKAREEDRDLEEAAKKLFNLGKDLLDQEEEQEKEDKLEEEQAEEEGDRREGGEEDENEEEEGSEEQERSKEEEGGEGVAVRTSSAREREEGQHTASQVEAEASGHAVYGKAREEDRDLEEAARDFFLQAKEV